MTYQGHIVLFVGGVGGAKLAHGLYHTLKPEQLTIIVNTGDDFWHYGLRICPDLDTIMYTLSGLVNRAQGWGVADDSFTAFETLRRYGENPWFRLGDQDLAIHMTRTARLTEGATLTQITRDLSTSVGIKCVILPMTDEPVGTIAHTHERGDLTFQEYFVKHRWQPALHRLSFTGIESARMTPQVRDAISRADALIIGPSNPWLSIQPILRVPDLRELVGGRDVPRIAVTPLIGGRAVKGPTAKIMAEFGLEVSVKTVVEYYGDLINGFAYDERDAAPELSADAAHIKLHALNTLMNDEQERQRLAQDIIAWLANWSET